MDLSLVLTQPDRPVGRKKILTPPPVKVLAEEHGIEVLQPSRLSEEGIEDAIRAQNPDFIIVQFDLYIVFYIRQGKYRSETGVPPVVLVEWRFPYKTMNTALCSEVTISPLPLD
jgi:hypothetical protein